eukprot:scaffold5166_cov100-Isochrysis_galbana.AAC.4
MRLRMLRCAITHLSSTQRRTLPRAYRPPTALIRVCSRGHYRRLALPCSISMLTHPLHAGAHPHFYPCAHPQVYSGAAASALTAVKACRAARATASQSRALTASAGASQLPPTANTEGRARYEGAVSAPMPPEGSHFT